MELDNYQIVEELIVRDCSVRLFRYDLVRLRDLWQKTKQSLKTNNNTVQNRETECQICGRLYSDKKKLDNHIEYEHIIRQYENKKKKKVTFSDHIIVYDAPELTFIKYGDLKNHIKVKHKRLKCYICHYCKTNFGDRTLFKVHIKLHCDTCGELQRDKTEYLHHRQNVCQPLEVTKCKICNNSFSTLNELMNHQCNHSCQNIIILGSEDGTNSGDCSKFSNNKNVLTQEHPTSDAGVKIPSVIDTINEIINNKFDIKNEIPLFLKPKVAIERFNLELVNVESLDNADVINLDDDDTLDSTGNMDILKTNASSNDIIVNNLGTPITKSKIIDGLENNSIISNEDLKKSDLKQALPNIDSSNYQRTITILNCEMDNIEPVVDNGVSKIRKKTTTSSYQCKYCLKYYLTKYTLKRHLDVMHTTYNEELQCELCHELFSSKKSLRDHIREHKKASKMQRLPKPRSDLNSQYFHFNLNQMTRISEDESILTNLLSPRAVSPDILTPNVINDHIRSVLTSQEPITGQTEGASSQVDTPRSVSNIFGQPHTIGGSSVMSKMPTHNAIVKNGVPHLFTREKPISRLDTLHVDFQNGPHEPICQMPRIVSTESLAAQNVVFQNRPHLPMEYMMALNSRSQNVAFLNRPHLPMNHMMAFPNRPHLPLDQMPHMASNGQAQNVSFHNRPHPFSDSKRKKKNRPHLPMDKNRPYLPMDHMVAFPNRPHLPMDNMVAFPNRPHLPMDQMPQMMASNAGAVAFENRPHLLMDQMPHMASNGQAQNELFHNGPHPFTGSKRKKKNRPHQPMDQMPQMPSNAGAQNVAFENRLHLLMDQMPRMASNGQAQNEPFHNRPHPFSGSKKKKKNRPHLPMYQMPDILLNTQENLFEREKRHMSKTRDFPRKSQPQTDADPVDDDVIVEVPCVNRNANDQSWSNGVFTIEIPNSKYQLVATEVPIEF